MNDAPETTRRRASQPGRSAVILAALALDVLLGDPPNRWHPTAWMGSLIGYTKRFRPQRAAPGTPRPFAELAYGAAIALGGAALAAALGETARRLTARLPTPLALLAQATLLKTTISLRGLDRAAGQVQAALAGEDLPAARRLVAYHLVSRETAALDSAGVTAAAIESVAENASDGVIAPMLAYAAGGLPLALAYRFANTADAMLGYHTPELEWLGKIPARLDDLLNWLPARLTGALLALAAPAAGGRPGEALRAMRRDARRTASPNAGFPMSAAAGALGVALEKRDHYRLNAAGRNPTPRDLQRARRLLWAMNLLCALGVSVVILPFFNKGIYVHRHLSMVKSKTPK